MAPEPGRQGKQAAMTSAAKAPEAIEIVSLQSASFAYGDKIVLADIDLQLHSGSSYALLGANGAGKSSLLRALKGLIKPSSGSISWHEHYAPEYQTLAGQKPDLLPRSGWDNLKFVADNDHEVLQRAIRICEHLNLLDVIRAPVSSLSAGKQQQINLTRALMFNPTLLLLDEPFASLDSQAASLLQELLDDYRQDGVLVFSSHSPNRVRQLAQQVIFIDNAEIHEISSTGKFFRTNTSQAARDFLRTFKAQGKG